MQEHLHHTQSYEDFERKNQETYQLYAGVFSSPAGRKILNDMRERFHVDQPTVNIAYPIDPLAMAFREGQRTVILRILNILKSGEK